MPDPNELVARRPPSKAAPVADDPFAPKKERIPFLSYRARRWGTKDGRAGIPASDEAQYFPPHLDKLRDLAERQLGGVAAQWNRWDNKPKQDFCNLKQQIAGDRKKHQKLKDELGKLGKGDASKAAQWARDNIAQAEKKLAAAASRKPPKDLKISPRIYWLVMGFFGLGEIPINQVAFGALRGNVVETTIMAVIVGAIIAGGGHVLAHSLRDQSTSRVRVGIQVAIVGFVVAFVVVAGLIRAGYIDALQNFLESSTRLPPFEAFLLFTLLSLLIFVVTLGIGFAAHHTKGESADKNEQDYKMAQTALSQANQALANLEGLDKTTDRARQEAALQAEIGRLEAQIDASKDELARVQAERERNFDVARSIASSVINLFQELMNDYRAANLRARRDGQHPPILRTGAMPDINIPPKLLDLDTTCAEDRVAELAQEL